MFGGTELLLVLAILLLFVGASQLPKLARSLGQSKKEFQKGLKEGESVEGPCPFCGVEVAENARFCPGCGRSAEDVVAEKKKVSS